MIYKVYIGEDTWFHPKNMDGFNLLIKNGFFELTNNIDDSNIIIFISPSPKEGKIVSTINFYDKRYKNKLIILGPHFSVFPTEYLKSIDYTINKNILYNTLSPWVRDYWKLKWGDCKIPLVTLPFPVDIELFKPNEMITKAEKKNIIIYIKNRRQCDYHFILEYINSNFNIEDIKIFDYCKRYDQNDYINNLNYAKCCIWIGRHESQGFALQEALSLNVPLLVYNVKLMSEEVNYENDYDYCSTKASVLSYWDERCGEFFHEKEEFVNTLNRFLNNIELNKYKPREFVEQYLSPIGTYNNYWRPVIENSVIHIK